MSFKNFIGKKEARFIALAVLGILLLGLSYHLRSILNPVLLSLLLAYILNPVVNYFEKLHVGRKTTIFILYITLTCILTFVFIIGTPYVINQASKLYKMIVYGDRYEDVNKNGQWDEGEKITHDIYSNGKYEPAHIVVVGNWAKEKIAEWNEEHPKNKIEWAYIIEEALKRENIEAHMGVIFIETSKLLGSALRTIGSLVDILSYIILIPLYTFFLLSSLNNIRDTMFAYLPIGQEDEIKRILYRIHSAVSNFFRGKLIICLSKGVLTWGSLYAMGIEFALLFGLIQAITSVVPFLVLLVGMIPTLLLVLVDQGASFLPIMGVLLSYGAIEALEGFVLTPWIMGKETGMHPLTVILSLLIGGKLFGVFGLILAIPIASTLKILSAEIILPQIREVLGRQVQLPNDIQ